MCAQGGKNQKYLGEQMTTKEWFLSQILGQNAEGENMRDHPARQRAARGELKLLCVPCDIASQSQALTLPRKNALLQWSRGYMPDRG